MANNTNGKEIREVLALESDDRLRGQNLDNKHKQLITWSLFFVSFSYGLTSYIIGPALNDMKVMLGTTTDDITIVFGCMLFGYTLGAIINGIVFNFLNRQLVLVFLLFLMASAISMAPHCTNIGILFGVAALSGFGAGGVDTAQVVWIIEIWGPKSSLYLQGIQFFFALGTFISPLITRPYLAKETDDTTNGTTISTTFGSTLETTISPSIVTTIVTNMTEISANITTMSTTSDSNTNESHIAIPFAIVGGILVITGFVLLSLHFFKRYVPPIEQNEAFVCKCPEKWKLIYIILGLLTLAPYVGMEVMNFQLMPTFSKYSYLSLSGSDSALVQSLMAGAFTLFRGINFLISIKFWSEKIIFLNIITIYIGNVVLFLYEYNHYSKSVLFVGAIITGSGFSTVFASVYAFLETQFTVSNNIGGIFVCTSGLMAAILPTLCGQFISEKPLSLVYINIICTTIIALSFTTLNVIIWSKSKSRKLSKFIH